jgi:NADPH:quinone reductase-like Zn-dependent oxidoreductase
MMKLYRVRQFGSLDGLQLIEEPQPAAPVARQVLVRVRASSLNFRDLLGLKGALQVSGPGMAPDHIPLCDGAGEVVAIGPEVTRVKVGDRVAATFHPGWIAGPAPHDLNVLGRSSGANDGMLAEYTRVDESELVIVPSHLSFEEAATLPCAGVTAWYALHGAQALLAGEDVLTIGTGGVSLFALQFAKLAGARVIATTTSSGKMDLLKQMGADVVIDTSADPKWHRQVLAATDGRGVDVALDVVGGELFENIVRATRGNGRVSLVGVLSRSTDGISPLVRGRGLNLNPTRVGSRLHFEQMNRAIAVNQLRPVIDRVFGFDEARAAFQHFESGVRAGKVVISHS